jgi:hypothetical protein
MKYFFSFFFLLFLSVQLGAQYLLPLDSAIKLVKTGKTAEERFNGMRRLDRFYYTTGLYDSSANLQKEMYLIANDLKRDTFMYLVFRAIGNRYTTRTDYNFGLENYFEAIKYATSDSIKASLYQNLAYVYAITENNEVALGYLKKGETLGINNFFFQNVLYGLVYNNLKKPDSALYYLKRADESDTRSYDPTVYAILPTQTGKSYELKGDSGLAEAYYKNAIAYCKKEKIVSAQIRHGNVYCDFLLSAGKYEEAKRIALENLGLHKRLKLMKALVPLQEYCEKYIRMRMKKTVHFIML